MEKLRAGMTVQVKEDKQLDRVLEFVGSSEMLDRDGEVIKADGWELDNYRRNPVILFAHNYRQPAVGKAVRVWVEKGRLKFKVQFPDMDEYSFADTLYKLYKGGYMNAVSVGFIPKEWEWGKEEDGPRRIYTRAELLELSLVPIPANPEALVTSRAIKSAMADGVLDDLEIGELKIMLDQWKKDMAEPSEPRESKKSNKDNPDIGEGQKMPSAAEQGTQKGTIPYRKYPLEPEDAPWDGPAQIREADTATLKKICAWYDSSNPDVKGAYKLPHHLASNLHTVWRGVAAAMTALLESRGGVDIPDGDRRGVYEHLAGHYRDFGKEPPEFKQLDGPVQACDRCGNIITVRHATPAEKTGTQEGDEPVKSYFDLLLQDLRAQQEHQRGIDEDELIEALKSMKKEE